MPMKKIELIFLPAPGAGHFVSAVEFSKRLLAFDARLSITILVLNFPSSPRTSRTITGGIRYIDLPQVDLPPPELFNESSEHAFSVYLASHRPHVRDAITRLQNDDVHIAGLFLDMFCTSMIDVANELDINSYIFFCSSSAFLGLILHKSGVTQFNESYPDSTIQCFRSPVPTRVLPGFAFNKLGYKTFMDLASRFKETKGIFINTCVELEPYAVKSLSDYYETAPVYPIGPVLDLDSKIHNRCDESERERIIRWLDEQSESSVVFLCFGSGGYFGEDQIREIAKGLSQSGQRFLWALRKPPTGDLITPSEYKEVELKGVLGDEFWCLLEEGKGLVCGWAPQVEILGHKGTGAFVSHCGWNSTLESLWFGKPIVTWPLYAEQQVNAFELVRELGIAVELTLDYRIPSGCTIVEASDVEKAVRCVMEKDNPVKFKAKEMAEVFRGSLVEGGSSFECVDRFIKGLIEETESHGDA